MRPSANRQPPSNEEIFDFEEFSSRSQKRLENSSISQNTRQVVQPIIVDSQGNPINSNPSYSNQNPRPIITDATNNLKNNGDVSPRQPFRSTYQSRFQAADSLTAPQNRFTTTGGYQPYSEYSRFTRSPGRKTELSPFRSQVIDKYNPTNEEPAKRAVAKPHRDSALRTSEFNNNSVEPPEEGNFDLNDPYLIDMIKKENDELNSLKKNQGSKPLREFGDGFTYLNIDSEDKPASWKSKSIVKEHKKYDEEDDGTGFFFGMCVAPRKKRDRDAEEQEKMNLAESKIGYNDGLNVKSSTVPRSSQLGTTKDISISSYTQNSNYNNTKYSNTNDYNNYGNQNQNNNIGNGYNNQTITAGNGYSSGIEIRTRR